MAHLDEADLLARADALLKELPPDTTDKVTFLRAQYDAGLGWIHYPEGFGGLGASFEHQQAVDDHLFAAGAPLNGRFTNAIGAGQCAATVLTYGSDERKHHYLPLLFTGEAQWCQLFSEPGSGSDLASLATRAVRDGDTWIVNGQKVWTSGAHHARYALLLARTDAESVKHAGITAFAVDMEDPGVDVRPLRQMSGGADFNEVFLSDVRIHDDDRLGDIGAGWAVSNTTLLHERYNMGTPPERGSGQIAIAVEAWNARSDKTSGAAVALKDQLMQRWVETEVLRLLSIRAGHLRVAGGTGPEGSLGKLANSVVGRHLTEFMPALLGPAATLIDSYEPEDMMAMMGTRRGGGMYGRGPYAVQKAFVGSPGIAIAGGTDQIQRNIIGDRVLGLPREPQLDKGVPWSQTLRN